VKIIHFRKYVSKKIILMILERCQNIQVISMSRYASKRLNPDSLELFSKRNIEIKIMIEPGRPSMLDRRLQLIL
jgi:hypothetical protein